LTDTATITDPARAWLPCWRCDRPQAIDAQMWLRNASAEDFHSHRSPSGLPLQCCRVRTIGQAA
jgi:hypothetical protein